MQATGKRGDNMLWYDAIKKALEILEYKENYAYFFGAKGQVMTDEVMEYLWEAYPNHFSKFTASDKKRIFNYTRGKIGFDCSGFVGHCVGDMVYSGALIEHCDHIAPSLAEGVAGSILYKPGHVGLDIGYGFFLHFPGEGRTCELGRIREGYIPWTKSGQHRNVDYTGADAR